MTRPKTLPALLACLLGKSAALFLLALGLLVPSLPARAPQYDMNAPILPDHAKTPGDVLPVTMKDICVPGYSKKVRNVPQAVKEAVYRAYGITRREPYEYEVDHLVSLELGGSNSARNLWPQSYKTTPWNARVKDRLENTYHYDVCKRGVDLRTVQTKIAGDWIAAYKERFKTDKPVPPKARRPKTAPPGGGIGAAPGATGVGHRTRRTTTGAAAVGGTKVWVNLNTGVYHYPGQRWYGNTANGMYMTEKDAQAHGYRPTMNGQ